MRFVTPVLVVKVVLDVIDGVGQIENYRAVARLDAALDRLGPASYAVSFVAVSGFFLFMRVKPYATASADVRRRFNLIYTGATVGMFPLLILGVVQLLKHGDLERIFPEWVVLGSLAMLMIFPVTLAYVIVVERAMDVRMVIHQGLQYALARRGSFVIQIVLSAIVIAIAAVELQRRQNVLQSMAILGVGFSAIVWLRKIAEGARAWIDRRFFRDAYNSEQILSGLSDEVRSIVETRPLLERVTQRISESLHVPCVAVLTEHGGWYRPAHSIGYPEPPRAELAESGPVIRRLTDEVEPARVRLDDQDSWTNAPEVPDEERRSLEALAPQLLLPLTVKRKLLGIISLGEKKSEAPYSGSDLRLLKSLATQTGLALANAHLTATIVEEVGRREKMTREIEIAREVQERLFPQRFPAVEGADYCGRCRTALGVGGDYYDFLSLPDGKFGIALGDISGKGIPAALMMASLQASLRAEAGRADNDIAGLMARVNQALYEASSEDRYATFFYGQYDPNTQMLTYVNGGHCAPMLFRAASGGHKIERLDVGGPVVGLIPECAFEQAEIMLERAVVDIEKGDRLVIFTDGISEAMNRDLEEWGEERLTAAIRATLDASASDSITRILHAADEFAAGAPQHDDMTLVIFQLWSDKRPVN
jgi:sigma-B regulation protein RsbU (phosphoserine phosphatase)